MTKILGIQEPFCTEIRGKIGEDVTPLPYSWWGIYQMRLCKEGKIPIRMKFYVPTNPRTVPQQSNRAKFADAVLAWQNLTYTEKQVYNSKAGGTHFSGYNLFIREYMLS